MSDFDYRSVRWPSVEIPVGTKFSLVPSRVEVTAVRAVKGSPCDHCVMSARFPLDNDIRQSGAMCSLLPNCHRVVFVPNDAASVAAYTKSVMTKELA